MLMCSGVDDGFSDGVGGQHWQDRIKEAKNIRDANLKKLSNMYLDIEGSMDSKSMTKLMEKLQVAGIKAVEAVKSFQEALEKLSKMDMDECQHKVLVMDSFAGLPSGVIMCGMGSGSRSMNHTIVLDYPDLICPEVDFNMTEERVMRQMEKLSGYLKPQRRTTKKERKKASLVEPKSQSEIWANKWDHKRK